MLLAAGTLVFGIPSYGDRYSVQVVDYSFVDSFYGIDNEGNFVINVIDDFSLYCGGVQNSSLCYETYYVRTHQTIFSLTPPNLQYDNGVGCAPARAIPT